MMPYPPYRTIIMVLSILGTGMWLFSTRIGSSRARDVPATIPGASEAVLNDTLGFQKIFVINLPSRSDRRDAMALAGALTGLKFEWIDGVAGDQVLDKVLPPDSLDRNMSKGNKGSWRAHMDALRAIIQQNLTTALILEDDIDWDIRLKPQLQNFSLAARLYLDRLPSRRSASATIALPSFPRHPPSPSDYGSPWDVLWLGHCGTTLPASAAPLVISLPHDHTVPSPAHLRPHPFANPDPALTAQPPHTRLVHGPGPGTTCTQAYAVSRAGAMKLLYRFGTQTFTAGWDLMLGDWCAGVYDRGVDEGRREAPVCLTVQPPLFVQHYGRGGASDITAPGGGFIDRGKEMSPYVRLSVRLNMGALVRGDGGKELQDQWPD